MAEADFTPVAARTEAAEIREGNPLNLTHGFFDSHPSDMSPRERVDMSGQYRAWSGVHAISRLLMASAVESSVRVEGAQDLDGNLTCGLLDALLTISSDRLEALEDKATQMELCKFRR
ncbi:hypothetical protein [Cupriavidus metallidurans]|uniref:hypothetical protein n=1 Tax=Cupriavidus metallidurans TaxID=119219 RepID=UPI00055D0689|nr:hypothetical protein [Cupriavidus metallidurans]